MRRLITPLLLLVFIDFSKSANQSQSTDTAQRLFSAATRQDSAQLDAVIADPLVLKDLSVIQRDSPALVQSASTGLRIDKVGEIWGDSAYVYFQPQHGKPDVGIDRGFVRRTGNWRV